MTNPNPLADAVRHAIRRRDGDREAEMERQAAKELLSALEELVEACRYVSPIVGAVATNASVKDIRNAGRFVSAVGRADRAIAKAKQAGVGYYP